ncbi:MAG: SDR family oxidoreductase [Lentimicrobium sp.]|jgi:NADP-dependent 3-hydroxy acid dehydrogenase YdfG|nr:SDR family oxidoreductase [Lentimicrobium sp.]
MGKVIFITGASSGIGNACAYRFAAQDNVLVLCGRRADRLQELVRDLEGNFQIRAIALSFDVRNREEVAAQISQLPEELQAPDVLINNAGLALGLDSFATGNQDAWDTMIETNVKGLLNITRALVPQMVARKSGHIINIGSIAGREAYPNGNIYCATKAAVDSLTKSMRIDLLPYGIKVTQIAPGAVETEFSTVRFLGDQEKAKAVYNGFEPLHAKDVADVVHYAASLPAHVNINDLLLMPTAQASAAIIHRENQ